jgi:hypothetical protein
MKGAAPKWKSRAERTRAVRALVERLGKKPEDVICKDLIEGHLSTLISKKGLSVYDVLREAGYEFSPLDRKRVPRFYWRDERNRVEAVRALVRKLGKPPGHITADDFRRGRLRSVLRYYGLVPANALRAAGYRLGTGDLKTKPHGHWKERKTRVAAIRRFAGKLGKPLWKVTVEDFIAGGISGVLPYYGGSVRRALADAYGKRPRELRIRISPEIHK